MTKLTDLQQSQVKLLKSTTSLVATRLQFIEVQDQQSEIERQINALEENLKDAIKVIWQMQNPNYLSIDAVINNTLNSYI